MADRITEKKIRFLCLALIWALSSQAIGNDQVIFKNKIKPFLNNYCVSCHGPEKAKGKIRLDSISSSMTSPKQAEQWARVLEALEFGEMPSDKATKFPTMKEARLVEKWIGNELSRQGVEVEEKSSSEGYGNLVNHELLFGAESRKSNITVAARLWRISPNSLIKQMIARLKVSDGVWLNSGEVFQRRMSGYQFDASTNPFKLDKPNGSFRDFKGKYLFNSMMAEQITELAISASEKLLESMREEHGKSKEIGKKIELLYGEYLRAHYQRVLRREPREEELLSLLKMAEKIDSELGENQGIIAAFSAVILQPESIFRFENASEKTTIPINEDEGSEIYPLSHRDLAHALTHAITDLPPNQKLLDRFMNAKEPVSELLREECKTLLNKNKLSHKRSLQFFQEYFDYEKSVDVFKDDKKRVHWAPSYVSDLDLIISKILEEDRQVLYQLLTTRNYRLTIVKSFSGASYLAYNLPADTKRNGEIIKMPKDQRMGVLTHPAWLVAHSGNFDNDPIRRGLWIRTKLLGGLVPDVPINVDAKLPEDETMTLRERMHVTRVDECYKCHSKMNSLGLPFERYNDFGRYRRTELGRPVDTTGAITRSGDPSIDGLVKDPFELIERLSRSKRVEQVFVRHAFRFFMGRNETLGDARTLQNAYKAYIENDGSFKALVISLLSSDSFIYRAKGIEKN